MRDEMGRNTVPPGSLAEQVNHGYPTTDLMEQKLWPTPRATPRMAYAEKPSPSMIKGTHGWNLNAAVTDSQQESLQEMADSESDGLLSSNGGLCDGDGNGLTQ